MGEKRTRLELLDALRGVTLISMMAYHGMWNLVYLFGVDCPWYRGTPGYLWQQSICWTFILLSGFCWSLGRRPGKRGVTVFGGGLVVSLVTHLLMPASRITFGILTFTGSAMLLLIPLEKLLRHVPAWLGLVGSGLLFALFRECSGWGLGRNLLTVYLGFPPPGFYSADYFPLLPWLFLFVAGYFLFRLLRDRGLTERLFARGNFPVLNWLGRNSLLVYLLHQPVLYGLCVLIFG